METERRTLAREVISKALLLVNGQSCWVGDASACNESDEVCDSRSAEAVKFGGYGSLHRAAHEIKSESRFAHDAYNAALELLDEVASMEVNLNALDHFATRSLFEKAILN